MRFGKAQVAAGHREAILAAARQCFAKNGFQATSMAQVARTSGISVGHVYNFFDTKDALIGAIIREDLKGFREMMARIEEAPDQERAFLEAIDSILEFLSDPVMAALSTEILSAAIRNPAVRETVQESDVTVRGALVKIFANGRSERELPGDFYPMVDMLMGLLRGIMSRGISSPNFDVMACRSLLRMWVAGLFDQGLKLV